MNPNPSNAVRIAPRLLFGLGILALGLLWTLDNIDVIESERITEWWPAILILIGAVRLFDSYKNKFWSVLLIAAGTVWLVDNLDIADVDLGDLFPLLIAAVGAKLIWDALRRGSYAPAVAGGDPGSLVTAFAVWAGVKRQITSEEFQGGDATAIMGGVEIDLRNAKIRDGEQAVLDTFALWGGVEVFVPKNWRIVTKVMPFMGGFEDKTLQDGTGPTLVIQGTAIMGAVVVQN